MALASAPQFYLPRQVALASDIRAGHTVVDVLAGHRGHMTFPAAELAGNAGRVYAVDVRRQAIDALRGVCELGYAGTVELVHGHPERVGGIPLSDGVADVVLLVDTLSLVQNQLETVREAHRLLRSGGILTVVDWHPYGQVHHGPRPERRLSAQEARSLCLVSPFAMEGAFETGDYHYGFTCRKR